MTIDDDVKRLGELSDELPAIDVDASTAERIARRVRDDVGKGPPRRRLLEPVLAAVIVTAYLVWAIIKVLELLG
ncbi:hypothetical protein BH11MYX3_BH11MYX3_42360 [soil metagenome]